VGINKKGYWIGHLDVRDPEGHNDYVVASTAAITRYGGRFLVRGGAFEQMEGYARARHVLIEFPSYAIALACYRSADYIRARKMRSNTAVADLAIVEGSVSTELTNYFPPG
jgi:uncharacterized protein (DUF1330 family)